MPRPRSWRPRTSHADIDGSGCRIGAATGSRPEVLLPGAPVVPEALPPLDLRNLTAQRVFKVRVARCPGTSYVSNDRGGGIDPAARGRQADERETTETYRGFPPRLAWPRAPRTRSVTDRPSRPWMTTRRAAISS